MSFLETMIQKLNEAGTCAFLLLIFLMTGCTVEEPPAHIVLLAPFEGRYREIGYDALYAANLALLDARRDDIALVAIDDGGNPEAAHLRASALARDRRVKAAIVVGYDASHPDVLLAFGDVPVVVVGSWAADPQQTNRFVMASQDIRQQLSHPERLDIIEATDVDTPYIGNEIFALNGYHKIRDDLVGITIVSGSRLPDDVYTQRILDTNLFATAPGLLSTLIYDSMGLVINAIEEGSRSRDDVTEHIAMINYTGMNGPIRFKNGYWQNAPIYRYVYNSERQLIHADNIIK